MRIAIILSNSLLDRQWSTTHGFFIIMGGFHLFERSFKETGNDDRCISYEDDKPLHPLREGDLSLHSESFTMPIEAEIEDRGKSDWLAKSLVLLQTSWFVMQCIARAVEHLRVTHLEIVTLAYAAMNFVTYIFWWNKPLNVNRPVRVFRKPGPNETQSQVDELTLEGQKLTWIYRLEPIFQFIAGYQDKDVELSRKDRVPMFWADNSDIIVADGIVLGVGVCFGAIHCIAWFFSFPTRAELLIWRILSVAITAVPIHIILMSVLANRLFTIDFDKFAITAVFFGPISGVILYIIARAVTLVLAFTSLRQLPPGAYETVHWTTFIPHV